ncbi:hypothetical protein FS749_011847 [Ceratobasidium sp. UAMH 11750]|nr:hypothetical protein FS749_011847 [Ceratobasidium sp. UAMH 11750]
MISGLTNEIVEKDPYNMAWAIAAPPARTMVQTPVALKSTLSALMAALLLLVELGVAEADAGAPVVEVVPPGAGGLVLVAWAEQVDGKEFVGMTVPVGTVLRLFSWIYKTRAKMGLTWSAYSLPKPLRKHVVGVVAGTVDAWLNRGEEPFVANAAWVQAINSAVKP